MSLRERTAKGFVDAYIRSERKLVTDLLRTGRLEREEWLKISEKLNEVAEDYGEGVKNAEEFIQDREELGKQIRKGRDQKETGIPRDEAFELYREHREQHEELLEDAFLESDRSTASFLYRMPLIKVRLFLSTLRYT